MTPAGATILNMIFPIVALIFCGVALMWQIYKLGYQHGVIDTMRQERLQDDNR